MTEIEKGRKSFLEKIEEGRKRLDKMEETMEEPNYKVKYETLMNKIKEMEKQAMENVRIFPEPYWPNAIDDRKKVIWFRNDVFEHAYSCGAMSAYHRILHEAEKL